MVVPRRRPGLDLLTFGTKPVEQGTQLLQHHLLRMAPIGRANAERVSSYVNDGAVPESRSAAWNSAAASETGMPEMLWRRTFIRSSASCSSIRSSACRKPERAVPGGSGTNGSARRTLRACDSGAPTSNAAKIVEHGPDVVEWSIDLSGERSLRHGARLLERRSPYSPRDTGRQGAAKALLPARRRQSVERASQRPRTRGP